jgi:phage tail-like protein
VQQAEIARLLPWVFQRTLREGEPLAGALGVMEAMHARPEAILAEIDRYLDPRRAPDAMVPYLARWVDLAWLLLDPPDDPVAGTVRPLASGLGRLRELVAGAASRAKTRGTVGGLVGFLEAATGVTGFQLVEEPPGPDGRPRPFHVLVRAPAAAERYADLIALIVRTEKPAHVTFDAAEIDFTAAVDGDVPDRRTTAARKVIAEPA